MVVNILCFHAFSTIIGLFSGDTETSGLFNVQNARTSCVQHTQYTQPTDQKDLITKDGNENLYTLSTAVF